MNDFDLLDELVMPPVYLDRVAASQLNMDVERMEAREQARLRNLEAEKNQSTEKEDDGPPPQNEDTERELTPLEKAIIDKLGT